MTIERDTHLRALLTEQVGRPMATRFRTLAVTAVVAFVLGGGMVGGALSAAAGVFAPAEPPARDMPGMVFDQLLDGGHTTGPLATYEGSDEIALDLGERPVDATGIAVYVQCRGTGAFEQVTGGQSSTGTCDPSAGFGQSTTTPPTDSIVSIIPAAPFEYTVWAQWIATPSPAEPSAAQVAAVADGTITDAERADAIERFTTCLSGSGFDVDIDTTGDTLSYSSTIAAFNSGVISRCLEAEIEQVELMWAAAQDNGIPR